MKFTSCGLLLLLLSIVSSAHASERYTIAVSEIATLLTQPPAAPGRYNRFLATLDNVDLVFMPPSRVELEFDKDYLDCIFPASTVTMGDPSSLLESQPLEVTYAYIFTLDEQSLSDLNAGSSIAIRRGFTYGGIRQSLPAKYVELDEDRVILQFLNLGRVDAIIGYLSDIQSATDSSQFPLPYYSLEQPIYSAREAFVCHKSPRNTAFIEQTNNAIRQWLMSNN